MTPRVTRLPLRVLPLVLPLALACTSPGTRAEIARLRARVDSLAVTVTAMNAAIQGGALTTKADTVTVDATGSASLGSASAPITIVEFTDYQCPFCARHAQATLPTLRRGFVDSGTVHYVVRDLPLEMHPLARAAAQAARCAGQQGPEQYWRYHDALFGAQPHLADSTFGVLARQLGLEPRRFEACRKSGEVAALVERDAREAAAVGLTGTPAFVIGRAVNGKVTGVVISGAYPLDQFRRAIEGALSRTSGVVSAGSTESLGGRSP
jgi:protein-disulfide isomerase